VLVVSGDAYIIDFEGEPARPLEARRAKTSPLRDVAGLLRSFDYAAATITNRDTVGSGPVTDQRRNEFIARFRSTGPKAFIEAYRRARGAEADARDERLLDLFLLEKAAYEVLYEAGNRPTWLSRPLAGLAALANRILDGVPGDGYGER